MRRFVWPRVERNCQFVQYQAKIPLTKRTSLYILVVLSIFISCVAGVMYFRTPRLPLYISNGLEIGSDFKLLSIDPLEVINSSSSETPTADKKTRIDNFNILGEVAINSDSKRRSIVNEIKSSIENWDGNYFNCFWPRHDIRFTIDGKIYDILICYQCHQYQLYCDGMKIGFGGVTGSPDLFNGVLQSAKVPMPKPFP